MKMTESQLVNSCLQYLESYKIFCYRQNTGAFKNERGGFYRCGTKGAPDIVAVVGGVYVGIECKVGKNSLSEAQKSFQRGLEAVGGYYLVIYSLDELETKLQRL